MKLIIPDNLSDEAKILVNALIDTRERELEVLDGLTRAQLVGEQDRKIEPPIWEMGHVGWFQEHWILRNLDKTEPIKPEAYQLYDSFNIPNSERWDLAFPSKEETLVYITDVLQRCINRLENRTLTEDDVYFYKLAINHEDMHSETMVHIRQTLSYPKPLIQKTRTALLDVDLNFELQDVSVPGGTFILGATRDMPFVLDNEKWGHEVEIRPFKISNTPVTTAQFEAFVNDNGYLQSQFWSEEGWAWREKAQASQPLYWRKEQDGSFCQLLFGEWEPLRPYHPMVNVNFYEAEAYCKWAGRRLPTEAEWELAASGIPTGDGAGFQQEKRWFPWGNQAPDQGTANLDSAALGPIDVRALPDSDSLFGCRQMIGNLWEWTSGNFDAYPGFEIDPYDTYSAPSFGQQKVLRGGCWVTRSRVIRNTWRNFYTPDRNNIYAGFRTCAL